MRRRILIIDPQEAFCGATGSLSQAFGVSELSVILERLRALETFLAGYPNRHELCVIRSEYRPGQFTGGELNQAYSNVCVPANSEDCNLSLPQRVLGCVPVFTKYEESAASVPELMEMLRVGALKEVLVAGFLTTSCVRKTALALRSALPHPMTVGVLQDLTASRASNYQNESGGVSRHEAALGEMRSAGVAISRSTSIRAPGGDQREESLH